MNSAIRPTRLIATFVVMGVAVALIPAGGVAQGRAWVPGPLALDTARLMRLRDRAGAPWQTRSTTHLTLYADSGSYAAGQLSPLADHAERAYDSVLRLLNLDRYASRIHVFYFDSAAALAAATGRPGTGGGFPEAQTVFLVVNAREPNPADAHELAHIVSLTAWGLNQAQDVWLREGLGTLAQPCWPASFQDMAAAARRVGDARTTADLSGGGFMAGDVNARFRAYVYSAALVEHLLKTYGLAKFQALWRRGADAAVDIYGKPLTALETTWAAKLPVAAPTVRGLDLMQVQRTGCRRFS